MYELYTGKRQDTSVHGATYDVCMRLMNRYLNRGHHLYTDNYYTSPTLFSHLYSRGTGACGTLRQNRKHVPLGIKNATPPKGETVVMSNGPLVILKHTDKRPVTMCSTIHKGIHVDTGKVTRHTQQPIIKPDAIIAYNKFLGCVDHSDQLLQYSAMRRRTLKWYKKVTFHLFYLCNVQAHIVYKLQILSSVQLSPIVTAGRPRSNPVELLRLNNDLNMHTLDQIKGNGKKKHIARSCVVCCPAERKMFQVRNMCVPKRPGRESTNECTGCKKTLCVTPCYKIYHTYMDTYTAYMKWKDAN